MAVTPACPACGAEGARAHGTVRSRVALFSGRALARCEACGLVFVTDPPGAGELEELNARYWGVAQPRSAYSDKLHEAQMWSRVEYLGSLLGSLEGRKVLDVGAGPGLLGRVIGARGWRVEYYAVESDPSCAGVLRSHGARQVWPGLDDCTERDLDLVVLSHVLEHVERPGGFLDTARRRLAPGGHLFIELPNQDHRHKADFGTHLLSFTPGSLSGLLGRIGLEVVDLQTVGPPLEALTAARAAPPSLKDRLRGVVPSPLWAAASVVADRRRAARSSLDTIAAALQLTTYGPDREWIRCLARA